MSWCISLWSPRGENLFSKDKASSNTDGRTLGKPFLLKILFLVTLQKSPNVDPFVLAYISQHFPFLISVTGLGCFY